MKLPTKAEIIKSQAILGFALGGGVAAVMIVLDNTRPFSVAVNSFIDRAIFQVCPFYILGFSNLVQGKTAWFLASIIGNAMLYSVLFIVGAIVFLLIRAVTNKFKT